MLPVGDIGGGAADQLGQFHLVAVQVIVQAGSGVRYDALMSVVDVCTRQKVQDKGGKEKPLSKLSFVELPENRGGG